MSANDIQVGGTHYKTKGLQHWDLMAEGDVPYLEGNASKYGYRWPKKNGLEDVEKFGHYVQKVLELFREGNYPTGNQLERSRWQQFCEENDVDRVSLNATNLILFWTCEEDLLACLELIPELKRRALWVQQSGKHPDLIPVFED